MISYEDALIRLGLCGGISIGIILGIIISYFWYFIYLENSNYREFKKYNFNKK